MPFGMQLRYWFHRASPAQRTATWIALGTVAALFAASVAMAPDDAEVSATGLEAVGDLDHTTANTSDDGGVTGSPQTDGTAEGGSTGSSSGGAPAVTGGSDPATGGGGGGSGGGSGQPPTPGGGPPVELVASDRGVTPEAVTVGFLLQNPAGLNGAGFSTGQRSDGQQYVRALAEWASRHGGVDGRAIEPVLRYTDPTSVEDQAAACRAMTDDAKVFGAVDVAAMLDTASLDCLTNREKGDTPFVHSVLWSTDWQRRSGGNEVSYQAAIDRISLTWARDLGAMKWFPHGATVGILGDKCPATQPTIVDVLAPALKANGAGKVVLGNHDCDIESVVSQPPNIATRFNLEGVTHVLIVTNFAAAQVFLSAASSQGYRPKYSTSDWFLNTSDATAANFPPDQFDGAIGIASLGSMLKPSGKAPYDGWQQCSQIAVDAGLPPIPPDQAESAELLSLCDNFLLFLDALDLAGPNPTRARWRAAVTQLGQRTSAVFGPSRFGPDKLSGSDTVHTVQWQRGCRCWRSISDFRPAAA